MSLKIKIFSLVFVLLIIFNCGINVSAEDVTVSARSAVLFDPQTNEVLYEKSAYEELAMASTTKIMTGFICAEHIKRNSDELVSITDEMVMVEGSSMGLKSGDTVLLSDLLAGMLLPSGNDAANAVAIHLSGSIDEFLKLMNEKAVQIGMENTHFETPSGLDGQLHYTTAYDMALLTKEAIKNEVFLSFFGMKNYTVEYNGGTSSLNLSNHNRLLTSYQHCIGGKTGYTDKAGRCLVTVSRQYNYDLICVTLDAGDDWNDHMKLFDYGFIGLEPTHFGEEFYQIADVSGSYFTVQIFESVRASKNDEKIERKIFLPRFIYSASYSRGEVIGSVVYYKNGEIFDLDIIIY